MSKTGHKTVAVQHPEQGPTDIDVKLAPLLVQLWERGIDTNQCCQEARPGEACIEFPGSAEVEQFLDLAGRPYKVEVETWEEGDDGAPSFRVRLLVFFPTKDAPRLTEAVAKAPREE